MKTGSLHNAAFAEAAHETVPEAATSELRLRRTSRHVNLPYLAPQAGCERHGNFQAAAGVHSPSSVDGGTTAAAAGFRELEQLGLCGSQ